MAKIILVGEARGRKEALFEHGFVGSSGVELARMLSQAEIGCSLPVKHPSELEMIRYWKRMKDEYDIEIANVFEDHPESNNILLYFTNMKEGIVTIPPLRPGKYLRKDLLRHLERLWHKIEEAKPNLVVALGNTAMWAVLGESGINKLRGTVKMSKRLGIKVLPTYHPASIMYEGQWKNRPIVVSDLEKAKKEAEYSDIRRIERYVTVEPTLGEIEEWSSRPADFYAIDIETDLGQIEMIGFAKSPTSALVIPFIDQHKPTWSYWSSVAEEVAAWKYVDKLLKKPIPKVFQNGVFDLSHLLRVGLRPVMCDDDTMLLHHSLYPEMLKGLGFLGSIYSSEVAWKQMRRRGNNLKRDE